MRSAKTLGFRFAALPVGLPPLADHPPRPRSPAAATLPTSRPTPRKRPRLPGTARRCGPFPIVRAHLAAPGAVAEVSPRYVEAVLAYEDRFFPGHPGVNPRSHCCAAGGVAVAWAHRLGRFDADHAGGAHAGAGGHHLALARRQAAPDGAGGAAELRLSKTEILSCTSPMRRWAACSKASSRRAAPISANPRWPLARRGGAAGGAAAIPVAPAGRTTFPSGPAEARDKVPDRLDAGWGEARR